MGPNLTQLKWLLLLIPMDSKYTTTSPTNDLAERAVKTVKSLLKYSTDLKWPTMLRQYLVWTKPVDGEKNQDRCSTGDIKTFIPQWPYSENFGTLDQKHKQSQKNTITDPTE